MIMKFEDRDMYISSVEFKSLEALLGFKEVLWEKSGKKIMIWSYDKKFVMYAVKICKVDHF